ncbi:hypothetical protein MNBD_NITROSPINAE01-982 [hydrothermal vent metagenome]|uniref:Cyclic nucleotide-binding domain-containing protein n=1 Tax=hydrothermal vent metagenome TaxID=652676 RepID=A0A3B1CDU7_9ZZZZ
MTIETIEAGEWIVTEGEIPAYFIYKLCKGEVSVYKNAERIREIKIKDGEKPIMIGLTALLRDDRMHMASVKAETDVVVDKHYIDQIRGILKNEVPEEIKKDIATMTGSIVAANEIVRLKNKLKDLGHVALDIPDSVSAGTNEVLSELKRLYELTMGDMKKIMN